MDDRAIDEEFEDIRCHVCDSQESDEFLVLCDGGECNRAAHHFAAIQN
jgi:hypothetical protein